MANKEMPINLATPTISTRTPQHTMINPPSGPTMMVLKPVPTAKGRDTVRTSVSPRNGTNEVLVLLMTHQKTR